jgi:hypothetical protein
MFTILIRPPLHLLLAEYIRADVGAERFLICTWQMLQAILQDILQQSIIRCTRCLQEAIMREASKCGWRMTDNSTNRMQTEHSAHGYKEICLLELNKSMCDERCAK